MSDATTLGVRALNSCRLRHRPTYVALRALLDCELNERHYQDLVAAASRKLLAKTSWRYYSFPILKEIDESKTPHYRDCMIGSPFTLLAESALLARLSSERAFAKHPNVYSYLWPRTNESGHNFRFYRYGYLSRNRRISKLLADDSENVAVVNDIRKFYPSIAWNDLDAKVAGRLQMIEDTQTLRAASRFIQAFRNACKQGVAVGPDISHMLADVALENVDSGMNKLWGDRYFRYVDDIIVVCKRSETEEVQKQLSGMIAPLELHPQKHDVVDGSTWANECPKMDRSASIDSFEGLMRACELILVNDPSRLQEFEDRFREGGFSIPFRRLAVKTRYSRFRRYLQRTFSRSLKQVGAIGVEGLVQVAERVRQSLISYFRQLPQTPPDQGTRRRWFVQNVRYRLNRLLYLSNGDSYSQLREIVPSGIEFEEQRQLLDALVSGDPLALLRFPGALVATYCELLIEDDAPAAPSNWPELEHRSMAESATLFNLYFGWPIPEEAKAKMYPGSRILMEVFTGENTSTDAITDQTFLDEFYSLLHDSAAETRLRYAQTRTSTSEVRGLEGLGLGDNYS